MPACWVTVGVGATDIFARVAQVVAPSRILVLDPCFSGYEQSYAQWATRFDRAPRAADAGSSHSSRMLPDVVHVALSADNDFDVVAQDVTQALESNDIDIVYLCTPNNPTGRALPLCVLEEILDVADSTGTYVLLDECFADLAGLESAVPLLSSHSTFIVVKAFTKTFAMAGLRLGYSICSDEALAADLRRVGMEWAVSTPSQVAGIAALEERGYLARSHGYSRGGRARLEAGLAAFGLRVVPSHANYVLFRSEKLLYDEALARGVVLRRCANFAGLDDHWYRVAVRTAAENERLLEVLGEVLE